VTNDRDSARRPTGPRVGTVTAKGGNAMKSLLKSAKHVKYVLGSMSAVMFAVGAGNGF
jgi:hypothetical protein